MLHQSFLQQLETAAAMFPAQLIAAAAANQGGSPSAGGTPTAQATEEALNLSTKSSKREKQEMTPKKVPKEPDNLPFNDLMAMAALPAGILIDLFSSFPGEGSFSFFHQFFADNFG